MSTSNETETEGNKHEPTYHSSYGDRMCIVLINLLLIRDLSLKVNITKESLISFEKAVKSENLWNPVKPEKRALLVLPPSTSFVNAYYSAVQRNAAFSAKLKNFKLKVIECQHFSKYLNSKLKCNNYAMTWLWNIAFHLIK
jgi:hypothetical protein